MIFRETKLNCEVDEVSFRISFSSPDVRKWLAKYVYMLKNCAFIGDEIIMDYLSESETSLRYWIEREIFKDYPPKYAQKLSRWVVSTAIRKGFVRLSASEDGKLLFDESLLRNVGRPKEE